MGNERKGTRGKFIFASTRAPVLVQKRVNYWFYFLWESAPLSFRISPLPSFKAGRSNRDQDGQGHRGPGHDGGLCDDEDGGCEGEKSMYVKLISSDDHEF